MNSILQAIADRITAYLNQDIQGYAPLSTGDPSHIGRHLQEADVVLIEGATRIASVIRYLTQSTWSHSILYVGPIPGRFEANGEPHVFIEADIVEGVISAPLSKYAATHSRICRPAGLGRSARRRVCEYAVSRIGHGYDLRNVLDLARYLLPVPLPARMRRRAMEFGSGDPTRAICSTLLAQAYYSEGYPILPSEESLGKAIAMTGVDGSGSLREIKRIRHHGLIVPRDFDISPYFAIVKPTVAEGFDFREVEWAGASLSLPAVSDYRLSQAAGMSRTETLPIAPTGQAV